MKNSIIQIIVLALATYAGVAVAQDEPLEEILVTATKTSATSVQDTSIAMTVFTEDLLLQKGITNFRDLEMFTPGLEIAVNGPLTTLVMRGMGSQADTSLSALGNVAVHFDGVIVEETGNWLGGFLDVDRVEVLRGPQGTLYGRNSTSGAINIITKNPGDELEYRGMASFGNYNFREFRGTLSGPISDTAGARVSILKRDHDGYVENFNPNADDGMDADTLVLNGTLDFDISDSFRAKVKIDFLDQEYSPNYRPATDTNAGILFGGTIYQDLWQINTDVDETVDERYVGGSLHLEKEISDSLMFRSITGYRDVETLSVTDFDTTEVPLGGFTGANEKQTFSEELQLIGTSDKSEWLVGFYYFDTEVDLNNLVEIFFPDPVLGLISINSVGDSARTAYALFGSLKYQLTEKLFLNTGIRYSYEEADTEVVEVLTSSNFGAFPPTLVTGADDWDSVDPKIGLDYFVNDDTMVYGYVATGFKSGAFNADGTPYDEETILTFEAGVKTTLLEGRMNFNVAAFHNQMEDMQVLIFDPTNLASFSSIQNAAEASVTGIEVDVTAIPIDGLLLSGSVTATDGEFERWEDALFFDGSVVDVSGNQIPFAPELSLNLSAHYTFELDNGGDLSIGTDYAWVDDVRYDPFENDTVTQKSYGTVSATIRLQSASERWSVELYGANLTEEEAFGWMITTPFSQPGLPDVAGSVIAPRTYGIRFTFNN